jgi:hypothetical protein
MSAHTPGPWIGAGPSFGDALPRFTTAILQDTPDDWTPEICFMPLLERDEEQEANANLIIAAPDLLAALKGLHDDLAEYSRINDLGAYDNHWMQRAREAIAKAEGK